MEIKGIIGDGNGFISYPKIFKYLGSFISYDLSNEYDINVRIKKANQSMCALQFVWEVDEVYSR